jgi:hypothetical protein
MLVAAAAADLRQQQQQQKLLWVCCCGYGLAKQAGGIQCIIVMARSGSKSTLMYELCELGRKQRRAAAAAAAAAGVLGAALLDAVSEEQLCVDFWMQQQQLQQLKSCHRIMMGSCQRFERKTAAASRLQF